MTADLAERITFGPGVPWSAFSQSEMSAWAKRSDISPMAIRVLFAAMGRHNKAGHAQFGKSELAEILGEIDMTTGEVVPARSDTVSKAITTAKHLGFIADDSTARCLIVHGYAFQKARGSASCTVHHA